MLNVQEIAHIQKGCGKIWGKGTWNFNYLVEKGEKDKFTQLYQNPLAMSQIKNLDDQIGVLRGHGIVHAKK